MLNEKEYIGQCLNSFKKQSYPKNKFDVIVVDGMSNDGSRDIVKNFIGQSSNIILLNNKEKNTPSAFNIGIKYSKSEYVGIFSAHSIPSNDYIENAMIKIIQLGNTVACIGGPMTATSGNLIGKAIASATMTPFGVGASVFHYAVEPQYVATVYQGFYKKYIFEKIGYFDVDLIRNQDDELNYRLRKNGYKIYFDPLIKSKYYNRSSIRKLMIQYFQYGLFKPMVFKKLKFGMQIHHFIPSGFVLYIFLILGLNNLTSLFYLPMYLYLIFCLYFSSNSSGSILEKLISIIIYPILHISYGTGFLFGIPKAFFFGKK